MVRVGLVGIGFMGWIHYLAYRQVPTVELTAICTRDPRKRAGDWRGIQGNFGPPGEQVDLSQVTAYADLEALLADPRIDLVDICLPPDLHVDAARRSLAAGKHVFIEKPLALTATEGQEIVAAARAAGKQLLVGQVLPYFNEYAEARRIIASGRYGRLLGGHFRRIISDPLWLKDFYDPRRVGGPLIDLHVHDAHFIRLLFGQPRAVTSQGRMRGEVVEYCNTLFEFADPTLVVSATSGVINQQGRPFTHGFEIHLERATLVYDFAIIAGQEPRLSPLTVLDGDGQAHVPQLGDGNPQRAFEAEIAEVARSLAAGQPSEILGGDLACDALVICQKQAESAQTGRRVEL
ncbi:MAG: Gfo/Idh/MocA family oxidoreductase [Pirellulales bacterium]